MTSDAMRLPRMPLIFLVCIIKISLAISLKVGHGIVSFGKARRDLQTAVSFSLKVDNALAPVQTVLCNLNYSSPGLDVFGECPLHTPALVVVDQNSGFIRGTVSVHDGKTYEIVSDKSKNTFSVDVMESAPSVHGCNALAPLPETQRKRRYTKIFKDSGDVDSSLTVTTKSFSCAYQAQRQLLLGVAVDIKAEEVVGVSNIKQYVVHMVAAASHFIYEPHLNVKLSVKYIMLSHPDSKNHAICRSNTTKQLHEFASWDAPSGKQDVMWHLLGYCNNAGGIALINAVCSSSKSTMKFANGAVWESAYANRGITNVGVYSQAPTDHYFDTVYGTWLTFAHEIGHLMGGLHPFAAGKDAEHGCNGGIMDYSCDSTAGSSCPSVNCRDLRRNHGNGLEWRVDSGNEDNICQTINRNGDACLRAQHDVSPVDMFRGSNAEPSIHDYDTATTTNGPILETPSNDDTTDLYLIIGGPVAGLIVCSIAISCVAKAIQKKQYKKIESQNYENINL